MLKPLMLGIGMLLFAGSAAFALSQQAELQRENGISSMTQVANEATLPATPDLPKATGAAESPPSPKAPVAESNAINSKLETLIVSKPEQPDATLLLAGASGVPFTSIALTAGSRDVTVSGFLVQRTGPGMDRIFEGVLVSDGNGESDERRFDSNHLAFLAGEFLIPAGESRTFTVYGSITDDLADYAGQAPTLSIVEIRASSPVQGPLPLTGTTQTVNDTLSIGGATVARGMYDPGVDRNRYINNTGIVFSGIRITASSMEDLSLGSITWDQVGTAGVSDIANVATIFDSTSYPVEIDDRSYISAFSPAIMIKKGQSIDLYVHGDLTTTGAGRSVQFDIEEDGIALIGNTYGFDVGVESENDPFFEGSVVTINAGTAVYIGQ